jgi:hypothetical protein
MGVGADPDASSGWNDGWKMPQKVTRGYGENRNPLFFSGGPRRNRTCNLLIKSANWDQKKQ